MPSQNRILVLFAHPALQRSRVNRNLAREIRDLDGVTFHDLYETYPDLDIDAPREQQLAESHDILVLQHPFYWYSTPAMLKEWQDVVLEHGWAYGHEGRALQGKMLLSAITAGGGEAAYGADGFNRFTVRQLLAPIEQTARLCGMDYLPPFVVHGTHRLTEPEIREQAKDYRRALEALRDGRIDLERARKHPRLNARLDEIIA